VSGGRGQGVLEDTRGVGQARQGNKGFKSMLLLTRSIVVVGDKNHTGNDNHCVSS